MKKKLVSICLSFLFAGLCFTGASAETADSTDALPVVASEKEFMQNPTTYCNPISLTQGSGRLLRGGEPVITIFEDDYYLFVSHKKGYWWSPDFVNWTYVDAPEPVVCIWGDPHNHGWETRYKKDNIFPYFDYRDYREEEYGWTEGGHPLKYNGRYYLLYSSIGLEFYSYGQGVYVADDPMGPYVYEEENPFTLKTTGVAPGGGHGSIFVDKNNNVWGAAMMPFAQSGGRGDTLISLYPAGVDEDGVMHGKTEFGDYPQYLPGVVENPIEDGFTGWVLLSLDKKIEASSTLENCWTAHAVDENTKSFWSAETGDPGEYITVDLGAECDIRGIQILWDKDPDTTRSRDPLDRYQSYTVEVSDDNENWTMVIDKSNNVQDLRSDYTELPAPVYARYVKLTNVFTPDDGKFAVKALRVFGNPEEATWTKVENVTVVRDKLDRRYAHLVWEQVDGAEGYIILRLRLSPATHRVTWKTHLKRRVEALNSI